MAHMEARDIFQMNSGITHMILIPTVDGYMLETMVIAGNLLLWCLSVGLLTDMEDGYGGEVTMSGYPTNHGVGCHIITADGHFQYLLAGSGFRPQEVPYIGDLDMWDGFKRLLMYRGCPLHLEKFTMATAITDLIA